MGAESLVIVLLVSSPQQSSSFVNGQAWSSSRDPAHVFVLLETLFQSFDIIAKRSGVFKVETVRK
jgi:hypothetical protein